MKSRIPHAAAVTLLCDDLPEATNRVELDPEVAGVGEALDPGNSNMAHLLGTDRMGSDPGRSVVNAWI
jgi:choline dehydrogenase-like flavoprotein